MKLLFKKITERRVCTGRINSKSVFKRDAFSSDTDQLSTGIYSLLKIAVDSRANIKPDCKPANRQMYLTLQQAVTDR